jgi:hypothetical protein
MESNLRIDQGANGAWFIYKKNGHAILGSHDKELIEKVFQFLINENKKL